MGEISIQEAMRQFLKSSRLKQGVQSVQVEEIWEQLMGKTIAKYTDKLEIRGNTLFISSKVAPLKNELIFQKETIKKRLNESFGEMVIKEIVVQ